jgi:uncharacterized protein (TIGR02145 family)
MKAIIFILIAILAFCSFNHKTNDGIPSVKIGTQVWTNKNLDVSTFSNGDTIPEIETQSEFFKTGWNGKPAWCYYKGDSSNRSEYGKLYNWYVVHDSRGLAPQGWHIPTDEEWTILTNYLGGDSVAGKKMKSAKEWDGDNSSIFNALPAGNSNLGMSYFLGIAADFWSATEAVSRDAWGRDLGSYTDQLGRGNYGKADGFSVRCIKDK